MRKTFRNLDEDSRRVLLILIAIALTSTIISIIARVLDSQLALGWFDGLAQNLGTEMIGVVMTFLLIENFVVKKQARRRFIQRIRSQSRDIAVDAIESLRAEKWDQDESLRGQNYTRITIKEAPFYDFDLQRVNFERSILHGAHFDGCDLLGAIFRSTELSAAIFKGTNLHGADFADAELDNNTILPDGSKYNPEEGSKQLRRFTDPDYSDPENPDPKKHVFWRPEPNEHGEYPWWYKPEDEIDQV